MKHLGLFAGIGGFELAARWMGWETVAWCEWNPFCQKVLKHHFPEAEGYGDITKTDFTKYANKIDIVTGGFPCQPYSEAGKRKGKDDERHLWPEMLRAIREIQPCYVVGENVRGLTNWNGGLVFDEVQADLEAEGFETLPFLLPACAVNAPHRRYRIWFIAYSKSNGDRRRLQNMEEAYGGKRKPQKHREENSEPWNNGKKRNVTDTSRKGLQGSQEYGGAYEIGENRNEQFAGCVSPSWQEFPAQSPVCRGNDGVPNRVDRIKALGNAIVPQVAFEIYKAIEQFEQLTTV